MQAVRARAGAGRSLRRTVAPLPAVPEGANQKKGDPDMATNSTGAVVITGASTGIGEACALRLDKQGWLVFAGVRREADA